MSRENVELVSSIQADWQRGDYGSAEWAHPEIEYVQGMSRENVEIVRNAFAAKQGTG